MLEVVYGLSSVALYCHRHTMPWVTMEMSSFLSWNLMRLISNISVVFTIHRRISLMAWQSDILVTWYINSIEKPLPSRQYFNGVYNYKIWKYSVLYWIIMHLYLKNIYILNLYGRICTVDICYPNILYTYFNRNSFNDCHNILNTACKINGLAPRRIFIQIM